GVVGSTRATFWNDHRMLSGACQLSLSMPAAPSAVPAGPAASAGGVGTVCPGDGSVRLHLVFSDRSSSGIGGAGSARAVPGGPVRLLSDRFIGFWPRRRLGSGREYHRGGPASRVSLPGLPARPEPVTGAAAPPGSRRTWPGSNR